MTWYFPNVFIYPFILGDKSLQSRPAVNLHELTLCLLLTFFSLCLVFNWMWVCYCLLLYSNLFFTFQGTEIQRAMKSCISYYKAGSNSNCRNALASLTQFYYFVALDLSFFIINWQNSHNFFGGESLDKIQKFLTR